MLLCFLQGVGLCHGISGNGYALLAMARATGQPHYLRAARAFALYAAQHWQQLYDTPDRPASMFEVGWCLQAVCLT
jgi:lantibiotic modifying enzyme